MRAIISRRVSPKRQNLHRKKVLGFIREQATPNKERSMHAPYRCMMRTDLKTKKKSLSLNRCPANAPPGGPETAFSRRSSTISDRTLISCMHRHMDMHACLRRCMTSHIPKGPNFHTSVPIAISGRYRIPRRKEEPFASMGSSGVNHRSGARSESYHIHSARPPGDNANALPIVTPHGTKKGKIFTPFCGSAVAANTFSEPHVVSARGFYNLYIWSFGAVYSNQRAMTSSTPLPGQPLIPQICLCNLPGVTSSHHRTLFKPP